MASPNKLAAGQVIKIPGRAPATPPAAAARRPRMPSPHRRTAEAKPRDDVAELLQKGKELEAKGNLEGAYAAYSDAAKKTPVNAEAVRRRDAIAGPRCCAASIARARRHSSGRISISRSPSGIASSRLDPNNQKAKLERERCLELKKKMADKFGGAAPAAAPK